MSFWSSLAHWTSFSYQTSTFYFYEPHDFGERLRRKPAGGSFSIKPPLRRKRLDPSSCAALFPTTSTSTTMPTSNSHTKDSQMVEVGGTHTGDEAELARMGYKQELRYIQFGLSIQPRLLKFMVPVNCQA